MSEPKTNFNPTVRLKTGSIDWKQRDISASQLDLIIKLYEKVELSRQDVLDYATRYYPKASKKVYISLNDFSQGTASEIINWLIQKGKDEGK